MTAQEILRLVEQGRYFVLSGTNTYTGTSTTTPPVTSYSSRKSFFFKITNANTGSSTVNLDGAGAVTLYKFGTTPLAAGDLPAGGIIEAVYDGANFQVIGGGIIFAYINQKINSAAANFNQTII